MERPRGAEIVSSMKRRPAEREGTVEVLKVGLGEQQTREGIVMLVVVVVLCSERDKERDKRGSECVCEIERRMRIYDDLGAYGQLRIYMVAPQ